MKATVRCITDGILSSGDVDLGLWAEAYAKAAALAVGGYTDLRNEVVSVSVSIVNTGSVDSNEVSQLYVEYPAAADQPIRQLRGFRCTLISAGANSTVTFSVRRRDISMCWYNR